MSGEVEIRLLGDLEIIRDGVAIGLPPSRKTRALLGYLIVSDRPVRRDRLCSLLWDVPDDPRGALRWSLTKLRGLIDDQSQRLLIADREHVTVDRAAARIDWCDLFSVTDAEFDVMDVNTLEHLAALYRGPFMDGLTISGCQEFNGWLLAERERARVRQVAILDHLVNQLRERPGRALPYARSRAELDPLNEAYHASVVDLLIESGLKSQAQQYYQTALLMLEADNVTPTGALDKALNRKSQNQEIEQVIGPDQPDRVAIKQVIRFCTARDGTRIAWSVAGEGPPLVKTANWLNHLEYDWESPVWSHLLHLLAADHSLVRYDERGNGLSDRDVQRIDLEGFVEDLEAVVEAAGVDRFPLLAISQGCVVAAAYAARHPDRVTRLIMHGGYRQGWRKRGNPQEIEAREAMQTLVKVGWGADTPAFRQLFSSLFFPSATAERQSAFSELQRQTTSPENAYRLMDAFGDLDSTPFLDKIQAPVLVTHCRGDLRVGVEQGRDLASRIPNARFVQLESDNHLFGDDEPAWPRFVEEVTAFLAEDNR